MKRYRNRTFEMLQNNISWIDVSKELGVHVQSVYNWRLGKDPLRHRAIEKAIKSIVAKRKKGVKQND